MNSFSFTAIPLGLGLSTLAHLHFCNRNLAQAEEERRRSITLSDQYQFDNFLKSCNERALLSELISLLENTLYPSDETSPSHPSSQNRANHHQSLESSSSAFIRIHHKKSPRTVAKGCHNSHTDSTTIDNAAKVPNEERYLSSTFSSSSSLPSTHRSTQQRGNQQKNAECNQPINSQGDSFETSSTVITAANSDDSAISIITHEQVELWIKACKELRTSQEKVLKSLSEVDMSGRSKDPCTWGLKVNVVSSLLFGTISFLQLVSPAEPFWTRLFGSQSLSTNSIFTGLGLTWRSTSFTSGNGSIAGIPSTTSLQFLPIAPTLLLSGIHFFVALRTRWSLRNIHQQTQPQRASIKRTRLLCSMLLRREQRLSYLLNRIKLHQNGSLAHSHLTQPVMSHVHIRPRNSIIIPRSFTIQGFNSYFENFGQRRRTTGCENENNGGTNNNLIQLFRFSNTCHIRDTISAFTLVLPDVMTRTFMEDPQEQSRVFSIELEALKQELIVFKSELL